MSTPTPQQWKHLEPRPGSFYRQLFIKGIRIKARDIYGRYVREETPMTPEEIAADLSLPLEAVLEAIAYCESNPPEIRKDFEREEALSEAAGLNDPSYKYHPKTRPITAEVWARIYRI